MYKLLTFLSYFKFELNIPKLYEDEDYRVIDNNNSIYYRMIIYEYGHILKKIIKLCPQDKKLLDFGSGKGIFLNIAQRFGYKVTGIETAYERAKFAQQKYNLEILKSYYQSGILKNSPFNVITFFHVLEHLPNPKEILYNLINDNLEDKGLIIIQVPKFLKPSIIYSQR